MYISLYLCLYSIFSYSYILYMYVHTHSETEQSVVRREWSDSSCFIYPIPFSR